MASVHPPVVLLVDDELDIREAVADVLQDAGYVVWSAENARAALARVDAEPRAPDAILIDLFMPGLPTLEFLRLLGERPACAGVRIVLMTGAPEGRIPGQVRCHTVLSKPFQVAPLLAALKDPADSPSEA